LPKRQERGNGRSISHVESRGGPTRQANNITAGDRLAKPITRTPGAGRDLSDAEAEAAHAIRSVAARNSQARAVTVPVSDVMKQRRRNFLHLAAGAAVMLGMRRIALALDYPTRLVRIIVGFSAGSAPDIVARLLAHSLSKHFGQSFIIENRPGAGSTIGTEMVVRAPSDGHTLLLALSSNTVNDTLYTHLNFNFVHDTVAVATIARGASVLVVTPSFPAQTGREFIAYVKANPGTIHFASAGIGSSSHIYAKLLMMMAEVDLLHVPYSGSYYPDVLSGRVPVAFSPAIGVIDYLRAGKLRALAVTSATRLKVLPEIPALDEVVPGYEASGWYGIVAPTKTSIEIIQALNKAINTIIADPDMRARLADLTLEPMPPLTPAEFGKLIAEDADKWGKVVKFANVQAE
jgi:tripartite-type tricarboxylate transporter receptor subunit TctC